MNRIMKIASILFALGSLGTIIFLTLSIFNDAASYPPYSRGVCIFIDMILLGGTLYFSYAIWVNSWRK